MNVKQKQNLDLIVGGFLLVMLRLPVILLGYFLRRDHTLGVKGDILFIKMQGGGSLVLAFPAVLSLRRHYSGNRFLLLTTPPVAQFGESLGVFDEIICVRDGNLCSLLLSAVQACVRCFRIDTVVDLEVYSRLTTVFSVLTAARNRIGFYLDLTLWRSRIHTHLIFFNRFSCVHYFYEQVAQILGAPIVSVKTCADQLIRKIPTVSRDSKRKRISIGHACSDMGTERMLTAKQWLKVFTKRNVTSEQIVFLGSKADYQCAQEIIDSARGNFPDASFVNMCGLLSLIESISYLNYSDEFWGIDSALLHYARLLGKKTISFWGPTDPMTRLRAIPETALEVYYNKVPCSPCIHVAESPPCQGNNVCIRSIFDEDNLCGVMDRIAISTLEKW